MKKKILQEKVKQLNNFKQTSKCYKLYLKRIPVQSWRKDVWYVQKNPSLTEYMALRILFSQALNYPVEQVDVKEEWRFFFLFYSISFKTQYPNWVKWIKQCTHSGKLNDTINNFNEKGKRKSLYSTHYRAF